jgi:vacuolar-type H+-ATPase subunit E/Vma4
MIALLSPNILKMLAGAAIVALLAYGAFSVNNFISAKHAADIAVVELTEKLADRDAEIEAMKQMAAQRVVAQKVADATETVIEGLRNGYTEVLRGVAGTKEEDDGPVAPVLRNAIDALGGMRSP